MKFLGNTRKITDDKPSLIKEPFKSDKITAIHMHMMKSAIPDKGFRFSGTVEFTNGRTKGEQSFSGSDLTDLFIQIKEFVENLE